MSTVLFVCLHNAGRSQMSQALFEHAANGRHTALSAGTIPGDRVHPVVVEVMREVDIDLAGRKPQVLTPELAEQADIVITMGCGDSCPYIPGKRYLDWDLPDPMGRPIQEVRATREEIAKRVSTLLAEMDSTRIELPVAIPDCSIDRSALAEQAERYARLGASATRLDRHPGRLEISFAPTVDEDLLNWTMAVERDCCSFLTLDYDISTRRLSVSAEPGRGDVLESILEALRGGFSTSD